MITLLREISWLAIVDCFLLFLIFYTFILLIKNAQSFLFLFGLTSIGILYILPHMFPLIGLAFIMHKFGPIFLFALFVIFQPELRKVVKNTGKGEQLFRPFFLNTEPQSPVVIKNILKAVDRLSNQKTGAIIVFEMGANLSEYIDSGISVNAIISSDLIISLFWPGTPTHDGALIIRDEKVAAAGCLLPLTESRMLDKRLGTRHMAAIGLSEVSDALIIVVSEESGTISLVENGNITRYLNRSALETLLFNLYSDATSKRKSLLDKIKKWIRT